MTNALQLKNEPAFVLVNYGKVSFNVLTIEFHAFQVCDFAPLVDGTYEFLRFIFLLIKSDLDPPLAFDAIFVFNEMLFDLLPFVNRLT